MIHPPMDFGFDCPLDLHCTYTRDQLLVAMDFMSPSSVREGVKWLPDKQIDVLFVREFKSDLVGAAPYTFLGTANYVKHTGSRPMNITWKLDHPIPAKYLKKTNKLVVG